MAQNLLSICSWYFSYRNTKQIVEHVNKECNSKMEYVAIEDEPVRKIGIHELEYKFAKDKYDSKCIICAAGVDCELRKEYPKLKDYINNVQEVKGLEFTKAYVVLDNMTMNEKYVALTRALKELVIVIR